tara:strand:+ start:726 stop:1967 length:1242 start_codon:yes stop_codon:yes gene_type:complete
MADRITGAINFSNNFEVLYQGPLDARLATPEYAQLTDSSIPFPYLGMLVAVTSDATADNNGVYMLTSANSTLEASWTKVGSDPSAGGNPITAIVYTKADGNLKVTLTHDGTGAGTPIEYDITIDTYESAIADTSTNVPTAVGGIGTSNTVGGLNGLTQNQMWDKLLFPTVNPTGGGAGTLLNDSYGLQEIQTILNVVLTSTAQQGTLSNPAGVWTGDVTDAVITGPGGPFNPAITTPATLGNVSANSHAVTQGIQSWQLTTTFAQGPMPKDSTGADYPSVRFNVGTRTNSTSFEGVWPIYIGTVAGQASFSKFGLKGQSANNIPITQNFAEVDGSLDHRIAVPVDMIQGSDISIELDAGQLGMQPSYSASGNAGGWVKTTMTFDVHPNASGIQYYLYTKSGSTGGANTYQFNW